jgi:hypothetical protein
MIVSSDDGWPCLSKHPLKQELYGREPYFREAAHELDTAFGGESVRVVQDLAIAVLKPDAFVGRRAGAALDYILGKNFTPIWFRKVFYTYHAIRELWRFQWNAATFQKMLLSEWIHEGVPAILMLLRDEDRSGDLPAAVRMKALKGHAEAGERRGETLRSVVDSPNRMMTIVHTADEPADIVRELGVFFDRRERDGLMRELPTLYANRRGVGTQLVRAVAALERQAPFCDFDPARALERLTRMLPADAREVFREQARSLADLDINAWKAFIATGLAADGDKWDLITVCAEAIEHQDLGYEPLISFNEAEVQAWHDHPCAPLARDPTG